RDDLVTGVQTCALPISRAADMKIRRMGQTGLKVSELCLGTMTFGNQCDEPASFAIMDRAAEAGVNFFDSADCYPVPPTPETAGQIGRASCRESEHDSER